MNRKEIEKMISLADDSYIEEMFTTRLYERKHHGAAWIAAAAAVVIAVGAAGIALQSANSDKIVTDLQEILTEDDYTDCEKYFTNELDLDEETNKQFWRDALYGDRDSYYISGSVYDFPRDYIDGITRFDTSSYGFCTAEMFCGKDDAPRRANITLTHSMNSTMINMIFYTDDSGIAKYFKEERYVPVIRNGVELYGFDLSENKDGSYLLAHWKVNETNYVFSSIRIGCEKFLEIIDQYLTGDFTLDSFDLNSSIRKHGRDYISPNEMNRNSVFAGYIPNYSPFAGLCLAEETSLNYEDYSSDGEILYRRYDHVFADPESYKNGNAEIYIYLIYEWGTYLNIFNISEVCDFPIIPFEEITPERLDEIRKDIAYTPNYSFIIPVNDFGITVMADCERERLIEAMDAIRSQGANDTAEEMIMYDGREYQRFMLSKETIEWLEWYNSLSEEEQLTVSYVPPELMTYFQY